MMIQICNPTAPAPGRANSNLDRAVRLAGARVAIVNNGWMSMTMISQLLSERLPAEFGVASIRTHVVEPNGGARKEVLESIGAEADVAIVGLANCGGCTSWSVQNQIDLLQKGVYAVLLVTERYRRLAEVIWRSRGIVNAPCIVLPITEDTEYGDPKTTAAIAGDTLHKVAELLSMRKAA